LTLELGADRHFYYVLNKSHICKYKEICGKVRKIRMVWVRSSDQSLGYEVGAIQLVWHFDRMF
jgi:hypothetical protein